MPWLRKPRQNRPRSKVATGLTILSEAENDLAVRIEKIEELLRDDSEPWCEESLLAMNLALLKAKRTLRRAINVAIENETQS